MTWRSQQGYSLIVVVFVAAKNMTEEIKQTEVPNSKTTTDRKNDHHTGIMVR